MVGRMLGPDTAIVAPILPGEFSTLTPAATTLPTSATFQLAPEDDAFVVYLGNAYDVTSDLCGTFNLHVYDGTHQNTIVLPPWGSTVVALGAGATVALGASDAWGNPITIPITVFPIGVPESFLDPDGTPETGTINPDWNYPLEWEAATTRVSCEPGSYFKIDYSAETRTSVCWIKHKVGSAWSPPLAVKLTPGRKVPVWGFAGEIAIMSCRSRTLAIEATDGATISNAAADKLTWRDQFTPVRTVNVASSAEILAAFADLQDGDDIVITAASITLASPILKDDINGIDFRLRSDDYNHATCLLIGDLTIDFVSAAAGICYIDGVSFVSAVSSTTGLTFHGGNFRIENASLLRLVGSPANLITIDFLSQAADVRLFDVQIAGDPASVSDLFDVSNAGQVQAGGVVHVIGCSHYGAGSGGSDNLATCHDYAIGVWWGTDFSTKGGGPSIVAATESADRMHLVDVWAEEGDATGNQFGGSERALGNALFCDLRDINANNGFTARCAIGCYAQVTSGVTNMFNEPAASGAYVFMGNVLEQTGGANGTGLRLRADSFQVIGNEFLGWARGYRVDDPNSTASLRQLIFGNEDDNANGADFAKNTQAPLLEIFANILKGTPSGGAGTTPKNTAVDGNLSVGAIDADITSASNRSTITPILNSTGSPNNRDADKTPQSTSNCDWETFAAGLSAGDKTTLRNRIGARKVGWMGVKGDPLVTSVTSFARGPRLRQVAGELVFPCVR